MRQVEAVIIRNDEDQEGILLTFTGVLNLKIYDLNMTQRVLWQIEDVSACSLENINYKVRDYENELFSLECKDIEMSECSVAEGPDASERVKDVRS
jgi:hypothetical protein